MSDRAWYYLILLVALAGCIIALAALQRTLTRTTPAPIDYRETLETI